MHDHDQIRRLFERAHDLSGTDREVFLMRECAAAPELLARLRAMLAAAADDRFLSLPDHVSPPTNRTKTMTRREGLRETHPGRRLAP